MLTHLIGMTEHGSYGWAYHDVAQLKLNPESGKNPFFFESSSF